MKLKPIFTATHTPSSNKNDPVMQQNIDGGPGCFWSVTTDTAVYWSIFLDGKHGWVHISAAGITCYPQITGKVNMSYRLRDHLGFCSDGTWYVHDLLDVSSKPIQYQAINQPEHFAQQELRAFHSESDQHLLVRAGYTGIYTLRFNHDARTVECISGPTNLHITEPVERNLFVRDAIAHTDQTVTYLLDENSNPYSNSVTGEKALGAPDHNGLLSGIENGQAKFTITNPTRKTKFILSPNGSLVTFLTTFLEKKDVKHSTQKIYQNGKLVPIEKSGTLNDQLIIQVNGDHVWLVRHNHRANMSDFDFTLATFE